MQKLIADAYAAADALISDAANSTTDFTTPAVAVTGGLAVPLSNLKAGTRYALQADGYNAAGKLESSAASSSKAFTTPAVAYGQVDTAIGTPSVPCK